jgi:hypothetical protein
MTRKIPLIGLAAISALALLGLRVHDSEATIRETVLTPTCFDCTVELSEGPGSVSYDSDFEVLWTITNGTGSTQTAYLAASGDGDVSTVSPYESTNPIVLDPYESVGVTGYYHLGSGSGCGFHNCGFAYMTITNADPASWEKTVILKP